ncbi:hypothetical protein Tco_0092458 [Tanacetum coccineum]
MKAQWEKPCLYYVQYDKNDLENMFAPESEETILLAEESLSKSGDLVKPYDYKRLNNLYDLFVPQQQKSREQLSVVELNCKNRIKKNGIIQLLTMSSCLLKKMLIPLAQDTVEKASLFETYLKKEMFKDLKYVQSLEKEIDDLRKDFNDFKSQIENENVSSRVDDLFLSDLYIIALQESSSPTPICFMTKASPSQAW